MSSESEGKEPVRVVAEATADHLSRIGSIIAAAVRDIAQEIGKWADDIATAPSTAERGTTAQKPPVTDTD
jgi:hypothetical protein